MKRERVVQTCTPENLRKHETLLTILRKIKDSSSDNFQIQIEIQEHLDNPFEEKGIHEIIDPKPKFYKGWLIITPEKYDELFSYTGITSKEIDNTLTFADTMYDNQDTEVTQIKNKHYLELNILNPSIEVNGTQYFLHLKYEETLIRTEANQPVKKNKEGELQTIDGFQIFINSTVEFGKHEPVFLLSDQIRDDILNKRVIISENTIKKYNLSETAQQVELQKSIVKNKD